MLVAAGYAPRYSQTPLDGEEMTRVRSSVQRLLDAHQPYPGIAVDRQWNVVLANQAAGLFLQGLPDHVITPAVNVFRVCLHPEGLAARTANFEEWASHLLAQMRRTIRATGDLGLEELEREIMAYENIRSLDDSEPTVRDDSDPGILIPFTLEAGGTELSLFTTLTTFGTPRDITLEEMVVELFYPADDRTERLLREMS